MRTRTARAVRPRIGLPAALALFVLVASALCIGLVACNDPAFAADAAATGHVGPLLLNAWPPLALALAVLVATRRPLFALALVGALVYVLFLVNAIKLELLDTPILPADFVLLGHLGDGGDLLLHYVGRRRIVLAIAAVLVLAALAWREPPWTRLRGLPRALVAALVATLAASLALGMPPWSSAYAAADSTYYSWSPTESAHKSGLFATMLRNAWESTFVLPAGDPQAADAFVASHRRTDVAPIPEGAALPDIVVLQSESFFDPARLRGFEPAQALPNLRRLERTARHGDLWVPTYGGGTIRTEFEVLTGIAMRYFPEVQYPYFRLTAVDLESIARVLARHGYRTLAVHPHAREFWNRAVAFSHLGFETFDSDEQFGDAPRSGYYVGDDALVDHVLAQLDADTGRPAFVFAISMENHGPYDAFPNADPARIAAQPVPDGLPVEQAAAMRGYLYHLESADRSLGKLADALRRRGRRTLLLFYGDHLPALPRQYEAVGFDDGALGPAQPVPWLLLDTAMDAPDPAPESTAAFYLPALLLATAGIDDGGYFSALETARRADRPAREWQPAEEPALRAAMLERQHRGAQ